MEFNKELVEKNFNILSSPNTSQEDRQKANLYLVNFQQCEQAFDISLLLLTHNYQQLQFVAAHLIYQKIRNNIENLLKNREVFLNYRELIFNKLIEGIRVYPTKVIDRLCLTISVFMIIGRNIYWDNCVEDIINFAKQSNEKCVISLIILENLSKEIQELNLSEIDRCKVKGLFSDNITQIDNFVTLILSSDLENENVISMKEMLLEKAFKLVQSMSYFGLNILKDSKLANNILRYFNEKNIELISNIFTESCVRSEMSKYYLYNDKYNLEEILESFDKDVLSSIENTVKLISEYTLKYLSNNSSGNNENLIIKHYKVVSKLGNILSDILENFIFILFLKNETSKITLQLLSFYIVIKNRKISRLFFEPISEMREFIMKGYLLANFSDSEKLQFCEYLIQIMEGVMANSKLETVNFTITNKINSMEDIYNDDIKIEDYEISCSDYRKFSEDVFYNIFLIFSNNFGNDGVKFFFSKFTSILEQANINSEEVLRNEQMLIIAEVVMFAVKSLFDALIAIRYDDIITSFISVFLKSKVLANDRLLHSFLIFLDQGSSFVAENDECVQLSIQLLSNLIKMRKLDIICCEVLLSLTDFLKKSYTDYFLICFPLFEERFDSLNKESLVYFANALCNLVTYKDKKKKSSLSIPIEEVIKYNLLILELARGKILSNYENYLAKNVILTSENQKILKESFIKSYAVVNVVLKEASYLNKNVFNALSFSFLENGLFITEKVFENYCSESSFITELSCIFTKIIVHLEEKSLVFFDNLNKIFLSCFSKNCDNYECLNVLSNLYQMAGLYDIEKLDLVTKNYHLITEIIHKNLSITKLRQIEIIETFAKLYNTVIEKARIIVYDKDKLFKDINLFCEAISNIAEPNLNKNIVKFFNRFINSSKLFPHEILVNYMENIVFVCVHSCSHFETGIGIALELARLLISSYKLKQEVCVGSIRKALKDNLFKKINSDDIDIICKFLAKFYKEENEIKEMVLNIINAGRNENLCDFANLLLKINLREKYGDLKKEPVVELD